MDKAEIGNNINRRRRYIKKTQSEIAEMINVSKSQISKWENAISLPTVTNFMKLSEAMNIKPEDLLNGNIEKDLIENKEQKELWRKLVIYFLCGIIMLFSFRLFFEICGIRISASTDVYEKEILSKKLLDDGKWEIRQIVRSNNDAAWADVLIYQKGDMIVDAEVLEVISYNGKPHSSYKASINEYNEFVIFLYYNQGDVIDSAIIQIESVEVE